MLIVDTFNMSEKDYILEYLYYSNETLKDDEDIKVLTKDNHRYFTNKEIEEYKNRRIANEFYQAFKRINRKLNYISRIVIIARHTEAVMLACDMLKNCEYKDITDKYKEMLEYKEEHKQSTKNSNRIIKALIFNFLQTSSDFWNCSSVSSFVRPEPMISNPPVFLY